MRSPAVAQRSVRFTLLRSEPSNWGEDDREPAPPLFIGEAYAFFLAYSTRFDACLLFGGLATWCLRKNNTGSLSRPLRTGAVSLGHVRLGL
jgi:hypothetical protein